MPRWLFHSLLTVLFWGIWGFIPRKLESLRAEQSQILSILGLLPIMAALGWRRERLGGPRFKRGCALAFAAGLVGCAGNLFFYRLLHAGQNAATIVPLTSLYPVITVLLAVVLLKERLAVVQLAGIALALQSIYLFNVGQASLSPFRWWILISPPMLLWGVAALLQKICTNDVSAELSTLCFLAALVVGSLGFIAMPSLNWQLSIAQWSWGFALGLFLGLGNLTFLAAFAAGGRAAIVSPMAGLYSVVTVALAVGLLGEKVAPREWLAIVLALGAVVALAWTPSTGPAEAPTRS